jgi:hypothetical protein
MPGNTNFAINATLGSRHVHLGSDVTRRVCDECRGIQAIMRRRGWRVGLLTELPPNEETVETPPTPCSPTSWKIPSRKLCFKRARLFLCTRRCPHSPFPFSPTPPVLPDLPSVNLLFASLSLQADGWQNAVPWHPVLIETRRPPALQHFASGVCVKESALHHFLSLHSFLPRPAQCTVQLNFNLRALKPRNLS